MVLWEQTMADSLEKLSMWFARMAKRDKAKMERQLEATAASEQQTSAVSIRERKRALSRRVAAGQGILPLPSRNVDPGPPPSDGDEDP